MVSVPVLQKGKIRGTVKTLSSLNLLSLLVSANDIGQPHEFLLDDDGEVLLPIGREHSAIVSQWPALATLPSGRIQSLSNLNAPELKGYLALRLPIGGSRLSILRLVSEDELYGERFHPCPFFILACSPSYYLCWPSASNECVKMRRG